jgi:hypothetical protein
MDDDLRSLFGSEKEEDEPFGTFTDPADLGFEDSNSRAASLSDVPAFPSFDDYGGPSAEAAPVAAGGKPRARSRPRRQSGGGSTVLGMTPQQRMILSIFLFLDVSVLGCLILVSIGAISLP